MKKILLLNPPGTLPYVRDYYCSKVAKGAYIYPPTDLLVQSGILSERYSVTVLDAIVERLTVPATLERIAGVAPDVILSLAGAVSWGEDAPFLGEVKHATGVPLIVSGDLFLDDPEKMLGGNSFIDAILLDFTTKDSIRYLEGEYSGIEHMVFRDSDGTVKNINREQKIREYGIPVPRHELFAGDYSYPFVRRRPFANVLTDYGCPFHCTFCVIGTVCFKQRPLDNLNVEFDALKRMGYREIYFNDQSFGIDRKRALSLCEMMIASGYGFGWVCWSRVDAINEELLVLMKRAGCHTILFGVESANETTLRAIGKGYGIADVERTFALCRKHGIRTLATFIIGLPGEDEAAVRASIEFALKLDPDFVSFNTLVPRAATSIRSLAIDSGWISEGLIRMDQSGTFAVMGSDKLTREGIVRLRGVALGRFYKRPGYISKRLLSARSMYELKRLFLDGKEVLFGE